MYLFRPLSCLRYVILGLFLLSSGPVLAANWTTQPQKQTPPPADYYKSCEELYEEMLDLMPQANNYYAGFWEDHLNSTAVTVGTMWNPVFVYMGVAAVRDYVEERRIRNTNQRISELRRVSGRKHCFIK